MIYWIFAVIVILCSCIAAVAGRMKTAALALWVCGLATGGLYITLGAEFLAIVQWIVSTLVVISFVFFSVMFGEFDYTERFFGSGKIGVGRILVFGSSLLVGIAFPALIWFGAANSGDFSLATPSADNDLISLGSRLLSENFLLLEILCLTLFIVLVGGGVIARPEKEEEES